MTRDDLFKKYTIKSSHAEWNDAIDNWNSVEIYRVMHNGELPKQSGDPERDHSARYILEFIDRVHNGSKKEKMSIIMRDDFGSLYLTAHRSVYRYAELILEELNRPKP